jgi:predicted nucleotidyltransferase
MRKEIFKTLVGSRLYSLNTDESDWDYRGVGLPSASDLLGLHDNALKHWDTVNDASTPGETSFYMITKFFLLLEKSNPTLTEMLFVPEDAIVHKNKLWDDICEFSKSQFITKRLIPSYFGYFKDAYTRVKDKKSQNNREWMIQTHGYDVKNASHCYRIAIQSIELMTTGVCHPKMSGVNRDIAFDMKIGKYSYNKTMDVLDCVYEDMKTAEKKCTLPDSPDMDKVNQYVTDIHSNIIKEYIKM